jgi:HPt (histidine-containing phosphotransfer) domain-containing protein
MADIIGAMYCHLDPDRAKDFAMDNEQMLNLAQTFVSSLENDLQSVQQALAAGDMAALHRLLHTLKGYVTFLCKDELAQQLIQLEAASRSLDFSQIQTRVNALSPLLALLHSEVIDWKSTVLQNHS